MSGALPPESEAVAAGDPADHGEMAARLAALDWAATPLGPMAAWPLSLRSAVGLMLASRQPIWIGWGESLVYLYNDAYRSIAGGKHPQALGRSTREVWHEIWPDIAPLLATAMAGKQGTYVEQQLLIMQRNGYPEETYYTFSYSPIPDDDGRPGGILCVNSEETQRVINGRQMALLRELASAGAASRESEQVLEGSLRALQGADRDLPFALLYLPTPGQQKSSTGSTVLELAGLVGIAADHPAALARVVAGAGTPTTPSARADRDEARTWPLADALERDAVVTVDDAERRFGAALPGGFWTQPCRRVALLPMRGCASDGGDGVLVVGLNPFRLLDDDYCSFLKLVAAQLNSSLQAAHAHETERRRAQSLAELDRAKTAFFSNISHEFRTPLTLMLDPLDDALTRSGDDLAAEVRERIELAHRNGLRLLKLVNTLLDFSRIESGRVDLQRQPVDLTRLTEELASSFRSTIERAGLRLVVDGGALPRLVPVDAEAWEKIVLNLLSNAFKFTHDGQITVRLRDDDGQAALLEIEDTGIGIPRDQLAHVFERFRRVEGARGRSFEGSGIGLALVRELVGLMGGRIDVDSEEGRGTCFRVRIPYDAVTPGADARTDAATEASDGGAPVATETEGDGDGLRTPASGGPATPDPLRVRRYLDEAEGWLVDTATRPAAAPRPVAAGAGSDDDTALRGACVVLADDNADMRSYVERLLQQAGATVVACADGEVALAEVRRLRPDLVLSDVMMPRLDGFGLLAALRGDPVLRDTPVFLLSARAGEWSRIDGLRAGADDYLIKPFTARDLMARIDVQLRVAHARRLRAQRLEAQNQLLVALNRVGAQIAAELDLERAVQIATDAATELSGAGFGAFFYNTLDAGGETYRLYALSGVSRSAFERFPMPRNTPMLAPTFQGESVVRSADITQDPRFGHNQPHRGMPSGHLPVRSYLAVPVVAQSGAVLGGILLGHPQADRFDANAEQLVTSIATLAATAIDKAQLYRSAQHEIERRAAVESALRESEQILEARVAERTQALQTANEELRLEAAERSRAEQALRQSQKMEGIGQLTGGVAHDFNNLLTVIIGNLETLQRAVSGPSARPAAALEHPIGQALRGAQRAASLTQRLLAFSRQQPLDPKAVDVNRLVGGMSDLLRRTLGEQVAVETVLAGGLWGTLVDPNQLEVAMLNLAVNARDAMPQGGKLTIETNNGFLDDAYAHAQSEVIPGQYVVIAITDNGVGMTRDVQSRAFEPFFTTKDVGHGTGLGLSQVYGFVKQSGGHVMLYSEPGRGTTVKIYLPRLLADFTDETKPAVEAKPVGGHGEWLLVVEDDDDVRRYTVSALRELGYQVVEAAQGRAALEQLAAHPQIELLFTDVGLPGGMNGRQLADAARQSRRDLRVLFTTGYARNAIVHDGRLDHGVQLITKPFTFAALAGKLREMLAWRTAVPCVLIVEDEPLLQELAMMQLTDVGLQVETASTATEALNRMRRTPDRFDVAIIDLGLPDSRGDQLLRQLRALKPSLPVIITSGAPLSELASLRNDLTSLLPKPYSATDLYAALTGLGFACEDT